MEEPAVPDRYILVVGTVNDISIDEGQQLRSIELSVVSEGSAF